MDSAPAPWNASGSALADRIDLDARRGEILEVETRTGGVPEQLDPAELVPANPAGGIHRAGAASVPGAPTATDGGAMCSCHEPSPATGDAAGTQPTHSFRRQAQDVGAGQSEGAGMTTLTVWKFESADGARGALDVLQRLQKEELIQIVDAAIVTWPQGRRKPKTEQLRSLAGVGALGGSFWGLLFGLLFFVPLLGMAVGAAVGAMTGSMADVGIDDGFIRRVREEVKEGTSALFVMSGNVVADRVLGEFRGTGARLVSTNLSTEQETKLREVFAEEDAERA